MPEQLMLFLDSYRYVLTIAGIILIATILMKGLTLLLGRYIHKSSEQLKVDPTKLLFLKNALRLIIFTAALFAIIYVIPAFRTLAVTLFASAGIFAAIIGLGSQQAFSNIFSGVFIVIFKPFKVNDHIRIGTDLVGIVEDITLRHTVIRDFENRRIVMPNSIISAATIVNSTMEDEKICQHYLIRIAYHSDLQRAFEIIREEAEKHPLSIDNRTEEQLADQEPIIQVRLVEITEFALLIRAWIWSASQPDAFRLRCELNEILVRRFREEGIEMPYPHRTLIVKNTPVLPLER